MPVRDGSTLFLYTDGLVEGRDLPLDEGIARLTAVLSERAALPLAELCDEVIERLRPEGLQDDIALVAVRLPREDRPRACGGRAGTGAGPRDPPLGAERPGQTRGRSAQTNLWPASTYQPCSVAISAIR